MTEHQNSPAKGQEPPKPLENKTAEPEAADAPAAATPAPTPAPAPQRMDPVRKWVLIFGAFCLFLLVWYLLADRMTPFTTQARVKAFVVSMAPQVAGRILSIDVHTDQKMKKGQLLAQIDPEDYRVALAQAEATLAQTVQKLKADSAAVDAAAAALESEKANRIKQRQNDERLRRIESDLPGAISQLRLEAAVASRSEAEAQVVEAEASLRKAIETRGPRDDKNPDLLAAQAALDKARLNLKYSRIVAPNDGLVTDLKLDVGNFATIGQPLMTFVADQKMWIEANLTENNLGRIKPGNPVDLVLDVWPGKPLHGRVRSVTYGVTAAEQTSTPGGLPTVQNTRDWLRDAQRFPVVIDFEDPAEAAQLGARAGSQVNVTVYTGDNPVLNALARWFLTGLSSVLSYAY
jgi:multidrug resistance efflux pump